MTHSIGPSSHKHHFDADRKHVGAKQQLPIPRPANILTTPHRVSLHRVSIQSAKAEASSGSHVVRLFSDAIRGAINLVLLGPQYLLPSELVQSAQNQMGTATEPKVKADLSLQKICKELPQLQKQLQSIQKSDPKTLASLIEMHHLLGKDLFLYFFEKYVPPGGSRIIADFFECVNTPQKKSRLINLLTLERSQKNLFIPIFLKHPFLWGSTLVEGLVENPRFARQFDTRYLMELPRATSIKVHTKLGIRLEQNKQKVFELFNLVGFYPSLIETFLDDDSIWKPDCAPTTTSTLFDQFCKMRENPAHTSLLLQTLRFHSDLIQLAEPLAKISDDHLKKRLYSLVKYGERRLVKSLLALSPKDEVTARLLAQANIENIPRLQALLRLASSDGNHPILKLLAEEKAEQPLSPYLDSLLKLQAQGHERLLKIALDILKKPIEMRSHSDIRLLDWIREGSLSLANDALLHCDEGFWKDLMNTPMSPAHCQQMRTLHLSLHALSPPLSSAQIQRIEHTALLILQKFGDGKGPAWIALLIFLVKHNPQLILKEFSTYDWEKMAKESETIEGRSRLLEGLSTNFDAYEKIVRGMIGDRLSKASKKTALTLAIADLLITPGGTINTAIIDLLPLIHHSEDYSYLHNALSAIRNDPFFSDHLELVQAPPPHSRQDQLVRSFLNIPASQTVTRFNAQTVALSALLWRPRQAKVGSCFGTSVIIQLCSSTTGLKQAFKDYISLLNLGYLTAGTPAQQFPFAFDAAAFRRCFPEDHFLTRVWEFTVASTAGGNSSFFIQARRNSTDAIFNALEEFVNKLRKISPQSAPFCSLLMEQRSLFRIKNALAARYLGFVQQERVGTWIIVARDTETPLVDSREGLCRFFITQFEQMMKELPTSSLPPEKTDPRTDILEFITNYIRSDQFLEVLFQQPITDIQFGFDPANPRPSGLVQPAGGQADRVLSAYHGTDVQTFYLPPDLHPLEGIFHYIQGLSKGAREAALKNPHSLQTVSTSGHSLNLRIGHLVAQVEKTRDIRPEITAMQKANAALMAIPLTQPLMNNLINQCFTSYDRNLVTVMKGPLLKALNELPPERRTIHGLCQVIIQVTASISKMKNPEQFAKSSMFRAIYRNESLRKILPPLFVIADTNYSGPESLAFGIDLDPECRTPLLVSASGLPSASSTIPWNVEPWKLFEIC